MKRLILLLLLLSFAVVPAQTLRRSDNANTKKTEPSKYEKQLQAIAASYDQTKLKALAEQYERKAIEDRKEVLAYALLHKIPVRYEKEDGRLLELRSITPDGTPVYYTTFNVDAAISTRANFLNSGGGLGLNLNGDDLTAHIWDGGLARSTHQEYDGAGGTNRFSIGDGTTALHYHSAHVTGTIIASGVVAASKGMAWQADAVGYDWNSDTSEATTAASGGMMISNHSYGYGASGIPDSWFGQYGSDARDWDQIMYNADYYLMVVAAGNDGADNSSNAAPLDGQSAYDKLSGHATAKNNLVVGNGLDANIDGSGNLISMSRNSGSSEGPTDDYRIKPDIMGNGTGLYSTYQNSNTAYNSISGTSMASPNVAGTLLLLQEHYNNVNSNFMKAATLKGLALHTADDVASGGPDTETGWGLLNAKRAAEVITAAGTSAVISELNLSNGATYQVTIQSDGVNPLMASISWTDPAHTIISGTNNNTPALVNDLDLNLSNGTTYNPWRLTGVSTNGTGDNDVDPFERVDISGASGQYTLTVSHDGTLTNGSQDFTLIVTGGTIAATSPQISYGTTTISDTEGTDCSYTDVTVPLNIAMAPSQNADVTFAINGGTAVNGVDYEILTPTVTFLQGQTASQNLTVRFYNDGVVESPETAIIDFTVNPNGGDASANPAADSLTITMNDDDSAPSTTTDVTLITEDFEDWTGWLNLDRDGDSYAFVPISFSSGGYTGFSGQFAGSETNMDILTGGGTGTANADNYLISPQVTIPSTTTNTAFIFSVGGFNTVEHYKLQWTTDVSNYSTIDAGTTLEERNSIVGDGEIRTVNRADLAGQTGYFVLRHYNSSGNNGLLLFDALSIVATTETPVQTAMNVGTSDQTDVPGAGMMFADDSGTGYMMASIDNTGGDDCGCVTTHVSRSGTSAQSYNGSTSPDLVMDKTFTISPTNAVSPAAVTVTFYFTEAEIAGWEAAAPGARANLVAARDDGSSLETATLSIGSFGSHVTLTGSFTGLDGTYYFGSLGAFVACTGVTKTWNGSNWSPAGVPGNTDMVIIDGNYTTATHGDLNACTLMINGGNTLTVSANGYLNVDGNINVASTATLEVEHTGSVVQVDPDGVVTNSGTINVNVTTPPLKQRDFVIMGSPMTAETRNGVFSGSYNVQENTPANFIPHSGVPSGGTNFADDNLDDWNPATGAINPGEGYLVYPQAAYIDPAYSGPPPVTTIAFPLTFTQGTLNTGNISRSVSYNGGINPDGTPNILANPYPSPIDASLLISNNSLISEVYFWEHLTEPSSAIPGANNINVSMDDISMYNGTMGVPAANDPGSSTMPNGVISTGQGFGIKSFGNGTVTFTNSMRLTTGNTTLRTTEDIEKLILKVAQDAYELGSYTGIAFRSNATAQWDENMDSNRLATMISLYSHLEDGSEQLGIQTRERFENGIKIPMGFASQVEEDTSYVISIAGLEGNELSNTSIYLIDHLENSITDLTQTNYEFRSNKGTFNNRFTLQFESEVLGTDNFNLESIGVYPNPTSGQLNILSPGAGIETISIHDVRGRTIDEISLNNERSYMVDMSAMEAALYFVTIRTESGSVTKRIVKK